MKTRQSVLKVLQQAKPDEVLSCEAVKAIIDREERRDTGDAVRNALLRLYRSGKVLRSSDQNGVRHGYKIAPSEFQTK